MKNQKKFQTITDELLKEMTPKGRKLFGELIGVILLHLDGIKFALKN